ncbi:MAG: DNA topoisomerase IV subunit A [Rhodospirillales bacterium]|jgi:topoisomerase-4 subunit A|nr:DNA topoisomerase IV subunit A [Rhodospirillales bacterium]
MTKAAPIGEIRDTPLAEALGERYLSYALSTIMSRSLPDVRDGLKPVHRRLLYAMRQLKLDPASGYKKCARVVGDVIGKYHPHGDVAVYETLVRLAQEFAVRYPLVDGQGNFGNIDGDNAAAMRYTEARMTAVAQALLDGIDENAVDFRDTYDGEDKEPVVLPSRFPNLLANGAAGIAVGMATNIPPHNVGELCDALVLLNRTPATTVDELVAVVRGPDFPTGGVLSEAPASILEAYRSGRGSFRLRARWQTESLGHGQYQIIITEIPYQVPKARIIERIAELLAARKLPMLADVRDESTEAVRVVLEPKSRTVEAEHLMEHLFRLTDLEVRVGLNMNVLGADNTPRVMNLKEVLVAFLEHRREVLVRRTEFRLDKIAHRLEILGGLLVAYLNLDEVIRIIREEDEPKAELIRAFGLTDTQAEAILNMRLRHLRRLEEQAIRTENAELTAEQADLRDLLASPQRLRKVIGAEMQDIRKAFGPDAPLGKRRTEIGDAPNAVVVPLEAMIEREPITVICSEKGWIRAIKGHIEDFSEVRYKEGDRGRFVLHAQTTDKLLAFATNGRFYTVGCDKLPGGRGNGEPLRLMIDLANGHDLVALLVCRPGGRLLLAGESGRGFVVEEDAVIAQTRAGKQILNLVDGEEAAVCTPVGAESDSVAVIGNNRKLLVFGLDEVPVMTRGRGVILQRYGKGGVISDVITFKFADGLTWPAGTRTRTETNLTPWRGKRAQAGRLPPGGFPRSNRFTGGPLA